MVQILEDRGPSFAQSILSGLAEGIPGAIHQYQQQKQQARQMQMENEAAKRLGIDLSGVQSSDMRKTLMADALQGRRDESKSMLDLARAQQLQNEKYSFEKELAESNQANKLGLQKEKQEEKDLEKQRVRDSAQQAFNGMARLLKNGRLGLGSGTKSSLFGGKFSEDAGEFQSLSGAIESILVEMVNKGTLSNTRFKYITETLIPKPTDRDATIKGKLKGLAQILDLDSSALGATNKESKSDNRLPLSSFLGEK